MHLSKLFHLLAAVLVVGTWGCSDQNSAPGDGKLNVFTGLPPVAFLAQEIGGEHIRVKSILPEGRSPHDYEPGPQDIRALVSGNVFLTTGMNFERSLEKTLKGGKCPVSDAGANVKRIAFSGESCTEHHHEHAATEKEATHAHEHDADELDPHIWLSLDNAAIMAKNICAELQKRDPVNAKEYQNNLKTLLGKIEQEKAYAKRELAPYAGREFYVYHPAFGYYGDMTGLKQIAIELGGREATAAHLVEVIRHARDAKVKTVFVQPQFNEITAKSLAQSIGGTVEPLDPLSFDLLQNIHRMTDVLKRGFMEEPKK